MTPLQQARKAAGQRLQAYWDRRLLKTNKERLDDQEHCIWLLIGVVIVLIILVIAK